MRTLWRGMALKLVLVWLPSGVPRLAVTQPGTGKTFWIWHGIRLRASHWVHRRIRAAAREEEEEEEEEEEDVDWTTEG